MTAPSTRAVAFRDRVAIGDAIADVAVAARRVAMGHVELARRELHDDVRRLLTGPVVYGAVAVILLGVSLLLGAFALMQVLSAWMPTPVAAMVLVVPILGVGVIAGVSARRRVLRRRRETRALSAAEPTPAEPPAA